MQSAKWMTLLVGSVVVLCSAGPTYATIIAQWAFETSSGAPVVIGQSAVGQVDDTGGHPSGPFHGTGYGNTLSYQSGVFASTHSLQFIEATQPNYDYVERAMPTAIAALTQGPFTIETWFKTTDTNRGVLFGTYDGTQKDDLNFEIYTGRIRGHI